MDWIKVTPDTMPPDDDMVIVTSEDDSGHRWVYVETVRWNKAENKWEFWHPDKFWDDFGEEVTHWMPLPEPASD